MDPNKSGPKETNKKKKNWTQRSWSQKKIGPKEAGPEQHVQNVYPVLDGVQFRKLTSMSCLILEAAKKMEVLLETWCLIPEAAICVPNKIWYLMMMSYPTLEAVPKARTTIQKTSLRHKGRMSQNQKNQNPERSKRLSKKYGASFIYFRYFKNCILK